MVAITHRNDNITPMQTAVYNVSLITIFGYVNLEITILLVHA